MNSSEIATVEEAARFFTEQAKLRPDWKITVEGMASAYCEQCETDCEREVDGDAIRASVDQNSKAVVIRIG